MKAIAIFLGGLLLLTAFVAVYYFYQRTSQNPNENISIFSPLPQSPSSSNNSQLPEGWQTHTSSNGFTINHPSDVIAEETPEGERFSKIGPTQSLGAELYDGISVLIRPGNLEDKTLRQLAEEKYTQMQNEETTNSITELQPVILGPHQGFKFRVSSLGEADFIYLQKSPVEYLEIINGTAEPSDRKQTFQETVEMMIGSISFL